MNRDSFLLFDTYVCIISDTRDVMTDEALVAVDAYVKSR